LLSQKNLEIKDSKYILKINTFEIGTRWF